jgi:hypothetical protein
MARSYRRLSPADEDEIWARLRAGHAAKPTARALGWSTSGVRGYLVRCGGIRPAARRRSAGRLSSPTGRTAATADTYSPSTAHQLTDHARNRYPIQSTPGSCSPLGRSLGRLVDTTPTGFSVKGASR